MIVFKSAPKNPRVPAVVAITGLAGSGKDTVADRLVEAWPFRKLSFALPLKRGLSAMFGVDFENMHRDEKEKPLPEIGVSPRRLMQTMGTEWGREIIHENIWVEIVREEIVRKRDRLPGLPVVINDLRFPNEANMISEIGGWLVYVDRPSIQHVERHPSEGAVKEEDCHIIIRNNLGIPSLIKNADRVAETALQYDQ